MADIVNFLGVIFYYSGGGHNQQCSGFAPDSVVPRSLQTVLGDPPGAPGVNLGRCKASALSAVPVLPFL